MLCRFEILIINRIFPGFFAEKISIRSKNNEKMVKSMSENMTFDFLKFTPKKK
jgi:hypothetical protein